MNRFLRIIRTVFLIWPFAGCMGNTIIPSSDYMVLDNIAYITHFPKIIEIEQGECLDLDIIGKSSLAIKDTILIVSTSDEYGLWSFFSLPEHKYLGKYLMKGNGPNELLDAPRVNKQNFYNKNGDLYVLLYDFQSGRSYNVNISKTLSNNQLVINHSRYALPSALFNLSRLNDTTLLCKEVNNTLNQQIRYMLIAGQRASTKNLEKLNISSSGVYGGLNILDTYTKCCPSRNIVIEAAMDLNQINLYSLDDSIGKTICVGAIVDNIRVIENIERKDRMVCYEHLEPFPNYFGALYIYDTAENIYYEKSKKNVLQFFDWCGNPLVEVKLDLMINSFDIDFLRGYLYTINYETDEVYIYDFHEVIDYLEKTK